MKVAIVGGAGRVGATTAFALQCGGIVDQIALIDVMEEPAQGEALDLRHGASLYGGQHFTAGGYELLERSDIVVVSAGLRRKPDESRLDLINRNVSLLREHILPPIADAHLPHHALLIMVANPVDILTHIAIEEAGLPPTQVFGTGTMLDTARLRGFVGEYFAVDPRQVDVLMLGEHGDTMVPIWSRGQVNGVPLESLEGSTPDAFTDIFQRTKTSGADVIRLKGGAAWSIALVTRAIVEAIALNRSVLLPLSVLQHGAFGMSDVCLSLPTPLGSAGVGDPIAIAVSDSEREALLHSASVLRDTMKQVRGGGSG